MDHTTRRPDQQPRIRVAIEGYIDRCGSHDGSQIHIPAGCTDRGEVWVTPTSVSIAEGADTTSQSPELDEARREAAMHFRHAMELRADLISLCDRVISFLEEFPTGAPTQVSQLQAWVRGIGLAARVGVDEPETPPAAGLDATERGRSA